MRGLTAHAGGLSRGSTLTCDVVHSVLRYSHSGDGVKLRIRAEVPSVRKMQRSRRVHPAEEQALLSASDQIDDVHETHVRHASSSNSSCSSSHFHKCSPPRANSGPLTLLLRPRFSWTRIKGESDVQGGSGNGSVEEGAGSWVGTTGVGADAAAAGARALAPGQRWSASRKRDVVLRLLCGESLDAVSRAVGVGRSIGWRSGRRGRWPVSNSG